MVAAFAGMVGLCCAQARPQRPTHPSQSPASRADDGQVYRNAELGFSYRIPFGWVDRTESLAAAQTKTNTETGDAAAETKGAAASKDHPGEQAKVLLGIFERPPEVTSDSVNSAVVIAYESTASYPGLKRAEDYVGAITQVATAQGFKMVGEAYPIEVESRSLVRADFVKSLSIKGQESAITMRQSTLIWVSGKRVMSFTFIAAGEDELDEIMDGLHFVPGKVLPR